MHVFLLFDFNFSLFYKTLEIIQLTLTIDDENKNYEYIYLNL